MLVAFLLGLLKDDRLGAKIQLFDGQLLRMRRSKFRREHKYHIHISLWFLISFQMFGTPLPPWRVPCHSLRVPDLPREIRARLPQHVEVPCFRFFEIAQALHSMLLRATESVRTPSWTMIHIPPFKLKIIPEWPLNMVVVTRFGP